MAFITGILKPGFVLSFGLVTLLAGRASAQIVSSAADNDMDPSFSADGWAEVTSHFQVVTAPQPAQGVRGGIGMSDFLPPPDGNAYTGGAQAGGAPGIEAEISKPIAGLVPGTEYAVEAYIMSDNIDGEDQTTDVYFDVSFCGASQESYHIPFLRKRTWIRQSLVFSANAASCGLSFRARGAAAAMDSAPSGWQPGVIGNGLNYIFLDSVQVASATESDFGIALRGPASFAASGSTETVNVTIANHGPADGTPPIVTYRLPRGVTALAGDDGTVSAGGDDGASWTCTTLQPPGRSEPIAAREDRGRDSPSQATLTCTRASPLASGQAIAFSFAIDFAPADAGTEITSRLAVSPSFLGGNVDRTTDNDAATFTTQASVAICGNGVVEGAESCDDGNMRAGDGCSPACAIESGFSCGGQPSQCELASCGEGDGSACPPCDASSSGSPASGNCIPPVSMTCSARPGAPSAPLFALVLALSGLVLVARRRRGQR